MELLKKIKFIVVHHTHTLIDSVEKLREFHIKVRGWEDIGYHYVIGNNSELTDDGKLYSGRDEKFQGAHALGFNEHSIGIVLIGNFDEKPPTEKQINTLLKFLRDKMRKHNIPSENIIGHNEVPEATTTCPGKFLDMNYIRNKLVVLKLSSAPKFQQPL